MTRTGGLGTGLVVGVLLGAAGVVAGPPAVQGGLRAAVPFVEAGVHDAVTAVGDLVKVTAPKTGGTAHG